MSGSRIAHLRGYRYDNTEKNLSFICAYLHERVGLFGGLAFRYHP